MQFICRFVQGRRADVYGFIYTESHFAVGLRFSLN